MAEQIPATDNPKQEACHKQSRAWGEAVCVHLLCKCMRGLPLGSATNAGLYMSPWLKLLPVCMQDMGFSLFD